MIKLFMEGGFFYMSLLTLELIGLLLAAWKAPAWVKEIGIIALVTGLLSTVIGIYMAADAIYEVGGMSPAIIWKGIQIALITTLYGGFIYLASLIIRIVQKPRI